ncbi:MAG: peptide chain release factor N(5)-glutamine methyltransferase [Thermodesulfovibrionia bacterium]
MRVIEKIRDTSRSLEGLGIDDPMREAELLIRHAMGIDTVTIYRDNPLLDKRVVEYVDEVLNRRLMHEPIQYIIGHVDFLGLRINVGRGVLIPRPETELMVEETIKLLMEWGSCPTILDLCTGSGCITLALARNLPNAKVYGTDISDIAIEYARKNAEINNIKDIAFLKGSLFEPIDELTTSPCIEPYAPRLTFDLIISNPPYIKSADIEYLQPEIRSWEPIIAIDGGEDGLDYYRQIIPNARHYLKDDGMLVMEICPEGAGRIVDMLEDTGYRGINIINDYAGMERIVMARWRG